MPCLVLGPQNVPDKCSWWADGVFQGWCRLCIKVTDPSIPFSAGSSLGCCMFCQRPHKTKRPFLTSLCLPPLFSSLLRVLLWRADGIIWKEEWPLAYCSTSKGTPCIHKANIYSQPSIFIVHAHCVMFIVPYGLSFGATCAYSTACAQWRCTGSGADFLYVEESRWNKIDRSCSYVEFHCKSQLISISQWNHPLNHADLLCTKPGSQSWFPRMPEKEKQVQQGPN